MRILGLLLAGALIAPAHAQDVIGARGFVAHTYVKKTKSRFFRFASPRLLTPELYQLVSRDGGRVLDYDPLCQCRDNDGLSAQILSVTGTPRRAVANVLLRFDGVGPTQRVTLTMTRSAAGWKIADIGSARVPSLKIWLARPQGSARVLRR